MPLKDRLPTITAIVMFVPIFILLVYDFVVWILWREATVSRLVDQYINYEANPLLQVGVGIIIGGILTHFIGWHPKRKR